MKKYFYSDSNEKHGPLSIDELKQENIAKDTLIWFEGLDDWTPASDLKEMIPILESRPPPIVATDNKFDSEKYEDKDAGDFDRVRQSSRSECCEEVLHTY